MPVVLCMQGQHATVGVVLDAGHLSCTSHSFLAGMLLKGRQNRDSCTVCNDITVCKQENCKPGQVQEPPTASLAYKACVQIGQT